MYYLLILAVGIERLIELVVAKRNARWAFSQGGKEFGHNHYPVMVTLHTALLLGCVIEVWGLHRPFIGWLGWPMLAVAVASQVLRWWCVTTLGRRWNTLVIVVPDAPLVRRGPYRFFHHPNYVAVVAEGLALPLVHTAWLTAIVFTLANWLLLRVRIRVENAALGYTHDAPATMQSTATRSGADDV
jgi:methyltransferase